MLPLLPNTVLADPIASQKATALVRAAVAEGTGDRTGPTTPSRDYERWASRWALARRLVGGTFDIWQHPHDIVPKWPGEDLADYEFRARLAEVFTMFGRTCEAMAGMLTLRDPQLSTDVPARVRADWEDLDGSGTPGPVFFAECLVNAFPTGRGAWLIDVPKSPTLAMGRASTLADEQAAGTRPFWRWYAAEDILEAKTARLPNGREAFVRVRLREVAELDDPTHAYATTDEVRVRIFDRLLVSELAANGTMAAVTYRLVAERKNVNGVLEEVELERGHVTNVSGIPFVPLLLGRRLGACESTIPLEPLLWLNVGHIRVRTDRRWNLALAANPTPHVAGLTDRRAGLSDEDARHEAGGGEFKVGPHHIVETEVHGTFDWKAAPSDAFVASTTEIQQILADAGAVALDFMAPDARAAETATAHLLDTGAQNASLGLAARRASAALTRALQFHAEYYGEASGGTATVNRDFVTTPVNPLLLDSLSKMELAGQLSLPTLLRVVLHYIKTGGVLTDADDLTPEKEVAAIATARAQADAALGDATGMQARVAGALQRAGAAADPSADPAAAPASGAASGAASGGAA